jgi:hypothetical protein
MGKSLDIAITPNSPEQRHSGVMSHRLARSCDLLAKVVVPKCLRETEKFSSDREQH